MHSSKGEKEANSFISPESVKVVAESVGIGGLPDEASQHLADEVTYRIKQVIQVSTRSRFSTGSNRSYKWVQGQGHIQGQKGHTGLQGQVIYSFKQVIQVGTRSRSYTGLNRSYRITGSRSSTVSNRSYRWVQGQGHLQDQTGHTGGYKVKVIYRIKQVIQVDTR